MYQQPWYLHCITYFTWNDTRMLLSGQCLFSTVCFLSMDSSSIRAVKLRHYLDISVVAFGLSAVSVNVGKNLPDGLKTDLIHLDSFYCKLGADQLENEAQINCLTSLIWSAFLKTIHDDDDKVKVKSHLTIWNSNFEVYVSTAFVDMDKVAVPTFISEAVSVCIRMDLYLAHLEQLLIGDSQRLGSLCICEHSNKWIESSKKRWHQFDSHVVSAQNYFGINIHPLVWRIALWDFFHQMVTLPSLCAWLVFLEPAVRPNHWYIKIFLASGFYQSNI